MHPCEGFSVMWSHLVTQTFGVAMKLLIEHIWYPVTSYLRFNQWEVAETRKKSQNQQEPTVKYRFFILGIIVGIIIGIIITTTLSILFHIYGKALCYLRLQLMIVFMIDLIGKIVKSGRCNVWKPSMTSSNTLFCSTDKKLSAYAYITTGYPHNREMGTS